MTRPKEITMQGLSLSWCPSWAGAGPHQHMLAALEMPPSPASAPQRCPGNWGNASAKPGIWDLTTNVSFWHYTATVSQY